MRGYIPLNTFISNIKNAIKAEKKLSSSSKPRSWYLDSVARAVGFRSWGLLHRKLQTATYPELDSIHTSIASNVEKVFPNAAAKYVELDVISCIKLHFERCEEFSMPDKSTESGYSHPYVRIDEKTKALFSDVYSASLLTHAISRLEELGPWCEDDSEIMFEYEF